LPSVQNTSQFPIMIAPRSDVQQNVRLLIINTVAGMKYPDSQYLPMFCHSAAPCYFRHGRFNLANCAFRFKWNDRYDRFRPCETLAEGIRTRVMPSPGKEYSHVDGVFAAGFGVGHGTR
jgi:hypothetical protein